MILDVNRASSRGRGAASASLAILAATVLGSTCVTGSRGAASAQRKREAAPATASRAPLPTATLRVAAPAVPARAPQPARVTEGEPRYEWWLDGDAQPIDADARAWLKAALEVVAAFREIGDIQGHVGSLQGEIGSIQGQIGALQGRIGSIQGEEGSLQGKIGSIQGEQGSLQGAIGSHQGAIGSLQAARWSASDDHKRGIDREIRQHEAAIRELEAELDGGTLAQRLAEAEAELRAYQKASRGKIRELERQIDAIDTEKIGQLEEEIENVHAQERIDEIERRVAPAIERLRALMSELGS